MNICPSCGEEFTCGYEMGKETCWCAEMNVIIPFEERTDEECLCRRCLSEGKLYKEDLLLELIQENKQT